MAVVAGRVQVAFDRGMRQVAGGHDMGDRGPEARWSLPRLGEVDFQEAAVAAVELDERIDRLDHPGAGGPAAADAGGERHDGHLAAGQRRPRPAGDRCAGQGHRARISSESSTSRMSRSTGKRFRARPIRPRWRSSRKLFVLDGVEAVVAADPPASASQSAAEVSAARPRHREEMVDHRPEQRERARGVGAAAGEVVDVGPALVGKASSAGPRSSGAPGAHSTAGGIIASVPESSVANVPCGLMRKS